MDDDWADVVRAVADAGADAIEVGIPFSDPVMDGPVIQEASQRALDAGATPQSILDELRRVDAGVPLAVMTYYNIAFHMGHERFAQLARRRRRRRRDPARPSARGSRSVVPRSPTPPGSRP